VVTKNKATAPAVAPVAALVAPTGKASALAVVSTPVLEPTSAAAPIITAARAGSEEARVFFKMPENVPVNVQSYTVAAYAAGVVKAKTSGSRSPITIKGLVNGNDYTFTVTALTSSGKKETSAASDVVTPLGIFGQ
jgi:hypothetical protein